MESLGAPPLFRGDPEQVIMPPKSDERWGTFVSATPYSDVDSKEHSEADSRNAVDYSFSDRTSQEAHPRYTKANGPLPASVSNSMESQSEHGLPTRKSSGARLAHPWQSEHVPSRITRPWLPTGLIATSRTVKEAGDLHRLRDYSQGRNKQTSDVKIPYPGFIDTKQKRRDEHPVIKAIQFPSQPSGDRRRGPPPRGMQQQSSFQVATAQSEHGPPSLDKSGGSRGVNRCHSDHGPSYHNSARVTQPWLKSKTRHEAEDPNTGAYEPFLGTIGIPSQFSGDRSSHSQQMQTKQSMQMKESKGVLTGDHQKKSHRRSSSASSGLAPPPAPPRRRPPRPSKSLDENVFMGQLGGPVRASRKAPTPTRRAPPNREAPKAARSLTENDLKGKLGRQPPRATKSQDENQFKDALGRHSGHCNTASEPPKKGAIPPLLARIMQRRASTGIAQVGPEPMKRRGSAGFEQVGPVPITKKRESAGFAPESRVNNISGPPLSLTALREAKNVSEGSHQTQPQVDHLLGNLDTVPQERVPINLNDTLDLDEFRRNLGRDRNPYLPRKFDKESYKHGIASLVLTIAETGPQPHSPPDSPPLSPIKKSAAIAA
jgi:hypothetical protein